MAWCLGGGGTPSGAFSMASLEGATPSEATGTGAAGVATKLPFKMPQLYSKQKSLCISQMLLHFLD